VIELDRTTWNAFVMNRDESWLVLFYKPNDDECRQMRDEYSQLGRTFHDIVKIGSINCILERSVCNDASVSTFPAIRWFGIDKNQNPEVYEGDTTAKLLGKYVNSMLPDYVTVLQDKYGMREWLERSQGPAIVLFTDKSSTPPLWKALSLEFLNRATFGVVLKCDKNGVFKGPLQRLYDVTIPQIVYLDSVQEVGMVAEKFTSQLSRKVLSLWILKLCAVRKKDNIHGAASFKEWTQQRLDNGDCGPSDGQFCFIWLKAGADKTVDAAMRGLAQKYKTDPVKLLYVSTELNPAILHTFGLSEAEETGDTFVAFRPKRNKYKIHQGNLDFPSLDAFIDGVLNGGPLTQIVRSPPKMEL